MTRKRVRQGLLSMLTSACPTCKGAGTVKSDLTLTAEIFRKVQAGAREGGGREVVIRAHPEIAHHIEAEERDGLERLQGLVARKVVVEGMPSYHREQYDLLFR